jgi:hypothetical protein
MNAELGYTMKANIRKEQRHPFYNSRYHYWTPRPRHFDLFINSGLEGIPGPCTRKRAFVAGCCDFDLTNAGGFLSSPAAPA